MLGNEFEASLASTNRPDRHRCASYATTLVSSPEAASSSVEIELQAERRLCYLSPVTVTQIMAGSLCQCASEVPTRTGRAAADTPPPHSCHEDERLRFGQGLVASFAVLYAVIVRTMTFVRQLRSPLQAGQRNADFRGLVNWNPMGHPHGHEESQRLNRRHRWTKCKLAEQSVASEQVPVLMGDVYAALVTTAVAWQTRVETIGTAVAWLMNTIAVLTLDRGTANPNGALALGLPLRSCSQLSRWGEHRGKSLHRVSRPPPRTSTTSLRSTPSVAASHIVTVSPLTSGVGTRSLAAAASSLSRSPSHSLFADCGLGLQLFHQRRPSAREGARSAH